MIRQLEVKGPVHCATFQLIWEPFVVMVGPNACGKSTRSLMPCCWYAMWVDQRH